MCCFIAANWLFSNVKRPTVGDEFHFSSRNRTPPSNTVTLGRCVPEAKARILGPSDIHVKAGSSVTLTCVINQGPHDLGTVFWYKNTEIVHTAEPHPNEADAEARVTIQVIVTSVLGPRAGCRSSRVGGLKFSGEVCFSENVP